MSQPAYDGMASGAFYPPSPQLLKNAWVFVSGYKADPDALAAALPPGLEPHPNGRVQMNMYGVNDEQTSGFGAFTLTYLTVEIDGHDSHAAEGTLAIPGRYMAFYWNSSSRMRAYVRETSGFPAIEALTTRERSGEKLESTLTLDGRTVITMAATVGDTAQMTVGGHLNYYGHRQFPSLDGGRPIVSEIVELPLPFVSDIYGASVDNIEFDFPNGHPAASLAPTQPLEDVETFYGPTTFTYSTGRTLIDYLRPTALAP